ncbi:hypothetical protein SLEP1_g7224 [Rubroshorea leprosula]|uniref:F-box domain-containing protein n=1 Tax=Rubroshorea leprosula TaxID=152421 RepID=A0AAV5HY04_9ROSI|nr:hypothetical protein SLEP1_g7224 [Rubroshorea leprosula]
MEVELAKSRKVQPRSQNYELRKHYELPNHILESIFKRLCSIDIFRAKAICPSWNSAAKSLLTSKSHMCLSKTPWLVIHPKEFGQQKRGNIYDDNIDASVCIKNLEENMVYSLRLKFELNCCIGSSHGWLIVASSEATPFLLNPFTLAVIQLPPIIDFPLDVRIKKFAAYNVNSKSQLPEGFWVKAIMTSAPCANNNYSVILIFARENLRRIAYSNNRDGSWSELDGKHASYQDVICHSNQLYALSSEGSIETWDFQEGCPEKCMDIHLPFPKKSLDKEKSFEKDFIRTLYLVEMGGEILLVVRYTFSRRPYGHSHPPIYETQIFHVYKLNFSEKKWMEVKSLKDHSMFLGKNHSVSISTQDSWSCKANSIYFVDDHVHLDSRTWNGYLDVGVYNMEDKSIGEIYKRHTMDPPPCWLVPGPS